MSTLEALNGLRRKLQQWTREVFGDIQKRKEKLMAKITEVQDLI